jgi:hypothetical protein
VHQEVVGFQEFGKEHPVPVFVGQFVGQQVYILMARCLQCIAQKPGFGVESVAQGALLWRGMGVGLGLIYSQGLQGISGAGLRLSAGSDDGFLQGGALGGAECGHVRRIR